MSDNARTLELGCAALESLGPNEWPRCKDNAAILAAVNGGAQNLGVIPEAILLIGTVPTDTDPVVIGGETYTFKTTPAADKDVQIGTLAASKAALAAAINEETALLIFASVDTNGVKIQLADAAGGTPVVGTAPSYALTETLTAAAEVWNQANLNAAGKARDLYQTTIKVACTAENLATVFTVPLAFTPTDLYFRVTDANGLPKPSCTGKAAISGDGIEVTFDSGGSAAIATDIMVIMAYGSDLV